EVAPGILRSPGWPAGYALLSGDTALLIDCPRPLAEVKAQGIKEVTGVLLTHHHRDSCAFVADYLKAKILVRAAEASAAWLKPDSVKKYWRESLPLRTSRTAYLVVPEGHEDVLCMLADHNSIFSGDWVIEAVATPGHTTDHFSFAVRRKDKAPLY